MVITLKRDAHCKECKAHLPAGARAKWYRNGDVYGLNCHERSGSLRRMTSGGEDYECSDTGYEDRCAREVGY